MQYDYKIQYTPGSNIPHADAMTRLPILDDPANKLVFEVDDIPEDDNEKPDETLPPHTPIQMRIRRELQSPKYDRLINSTSTKTGGTVAKHKNWRNCSQAEKPMQHRNSLEIRFGCIYKNEKLFVPKALRQTVIKQAHDTHMGIRQTIQKIMPHFWWPGLYRDVESYIRHCQDCASARPQPCSRNRSLATCRSLEKTTYGLGPRTTSRRHTYRCRRRVRVDRSPPLCQQDR
eukprot:Pompholyxophrys_punicea_v1_NODE_227_length_2683_cov_13.396650.p2 type:complete len:231 gc:universal NODE_227_length_2683_cov_13.396650:779-87(-)